MAAIKRRRRFKRELMTFNEFMEISTLPWGDWSASDIERFRQESERSDDSAGFERWIAAHRRLRKLIDSGASVHEALTADREGSHAA